MKKDLYEDFLIKIRSEINRQRELQILEMLKVNGFEFQNDVELKTFAQERCEICSFVDSNRKILNVDGHYMCEWDETYDIDFAKKIIKIG